MVPPAIKQNDVDCAASPRPDKVGPRLSDNIIEYNLFAAAPFQMMTERGGRPTMMTVMMSTERECSYRWVNGLR